MIKVISSEKKPIKMWLDDIEEEALSQLKDLANFPFTFKWPCAMPDGHLGYGMPIGGVLATTDGIIIPNAVGQDQGCGVRFVRLSITHISKDTIKNVFALIRRVVPVGFKHHKSAQDWDGFNEAPDTNILQDLIPSAKKQLGTLGSNNHFIEIQKGDDGHIGVMLHTGSRNFGYRLATYYAKLAKKMCMKWASDIPTMELAFLPIDTKEGKEYFNSMNFCLAFAKENRRLMMERIIESISKYVNISIEHEVDIHHNYATFENHYGKNVIVHRKGATRAYEGQEGIIPGSVGSNSYIVEGLGNPESFKSCSHGAGRSMSITKAKKDLDLKKEQELVKDIVFDINSQQDLGESTGAYKNVYTVMENQMDLIKIKTELTTLGLIKEQSRTKRRK